MSQLLENTVRPDLIAASQLVPSYRPIPEPESDGGWNLDDLAGRLVELSAAASSAALTAATSLLVAAQLRSEPTAWIAVGDSSVYPVDLAESGVDLDALPIVRATNVLVASRASERLLRSGSFALVIVDLIGWNPRRPDPRRYGRSFAPTYSDNGEYNAQRVFYETEQKRAARERSRKSRKIGQERRYVAEASSGRAGRSANGWAGRSELYLPASSQSRLAGLAKKHRTVLLFLTRKEESAPSIGSLVSLRGIGRVRKTSFDCFAWTLEVHKDKHRGPGWTHSEVCRGPTGLY